MSDRVRQANSGSPTTGQTVNPAPTQRSADAAKNCCCGTDRRPYTCPMLKLGELIAPRRMGTDFRSALS